MGVGGCGGVCVRARVREGVRACMCERKRGIILCITTLSEWGADNAELQVHVPQGHSSVKQQEFLKILLLPP